jgi:hydrogenase-4 membrane subunit HyfE
LNPLLFSLLGVILVPLFMASWRTSLFGLAGQGALMALVSYRLEHASHSLGHWLTLFDLAVVRGLLVPLTLYGVLRAQNARARNDVIPPNLISWTVAIAMVLISFSFAGTLLTTHDGQQTLVAVASAGLMLGLLVLSTRADPLSQVIGALRVENAIALFELGGDPHEAQVFVQLGLIGVFVATVALFAWYLSWLNPEGPDVTRASAVEGPTL